MLAPLLAGCPGPGGEDLPIELPPGGLVLPDCTENQILVTTEAGKAICANSPLKPISLPGSCTDQPVQALNSDGTNLTCVNVPQGGNTNPQNTRIDVLNTKITDLTTKANNIKASGGAVAIYQGATTDKQIGNILKAGDDNSLVSAAKLCAAQYGAGAHMCNVDEVYYSVLAGKISTANQITEKLWIYAPRGINPISGSVSPNLGLGDNCASYTYPTGDKFWSGTAITTGVISETTRWGVRFHTGAEAPCNGGGFKIACCK